VDVTLDKEVSITFWKLSRSRVPTADPDWNPDWVHLLNVGVLWMVLFKMERINLILYNIVYENDDIVTE